jgi:hypothetical protein
MTSLQLNDYDQQYEVSAPLTDHTAEPRVEEPIVVTEEQPERDLFNLARAISYRANARKRFSRATSVI